MFESAPAKINLFLHVTARRADGYHLLDSLAVFAGAADRLEGAAASRLALTVAGPFADGLTVEADNLVLRAAQVLARHGARPPVAALRLEKNLPVASGIGGGSADAAAALRLLARLWEMPLDPTAMQAIAVQLGADVPVCLDCRPTRMGGVGEVLTPAPRLPAGLGMVLVNPGLALATAAVFRAREAAFSPPAKLADAWADAGAMAADLARLSNDLEAPAMALCPPIAVVLAALRAMPGALLARMSGSGATCFALFGSVAAARAAAAALGRAEPGWWCWGGGLHGSD
ncbi:MAG: 4-(cytidine 5'-diphospho)-2-C-methyl-D-erythritol kinase [Rhodospirillales bacterium]|nr:4-(cytidine 5'-diphospho)-2-C-methyl-D-erythritol kinase [Rhodospirillales bacterium]